MGRVSHSSLREFTLLLVKSQLVAKRLLKETLRARRYELSPEELAKLLIAEGHLTEWQYQQLKTSNRPRFFLGKYKLLKPLGQGGMGSVFLAEHVRMQRQVAIKVLPKKLAADERMLARFHREARAIACMNHPNIVRAYEVDSVHGLHYLAMEFVAGQDLGELVAKSGPLDPETAARVIAQAADGLAHAHATGIVHRDIKPANLLLGDDGQIRILDLGVALLTDENHSITAGQSLGTTDYLAPEQALDSHKIDHRADIYSLGATLYFVLTGNPPFAGRTLAEVLLKHQQADPEPIENVRPGVPPELTALCRRMMAKKPDARPQTAAEIYAELRGKTKPAIAEPTNNPSTAAASRPSDSEIAQDEDTPVETQTVVDPGRKQVGTPPAETSPSNELPQAPASPATERDEVATDVAPDVDAQAEEVAEAAPPQNEEKRPPQDEEQQPEPKSETQPDAAVIDHHEDIETAPTVLSQKPGEDPARAESDESDAKPAAMLPEEEEEEKSGAVSSVSYDESQAPTVITSRPPEDPAPVESAAEPEAKTPAPEQPAEPPVAAKAETQPAAPPADSQEDSDSHKESDSRTPNPVAAITAQLRENLARAKAELQAKAERAEQEQPATPEQHATPEEPATPEESPAPQVEAKLDAPTIAPKEEDDSRTVSPFAAIAARMQEEQARAQAAKPPKPDAPSAAPQEESDSGTASPSGTIGSRMNRVDLIRAKSEGKFEAKPPEHEAPSDSQLESGSDAKPSVRSAEGDRRAASPAATVAARVSTQDQVRADVAAPVAIKKPKSRLWLVALLLALAALTSLPMVLVFALPAPPPQPVTVVGAAALNGSWLLDAPPLPTAGTDSQLALAAAGLPAPVIAQEADDASATGLGDLLSTALPAAMPANKPPQLSILWISGHGVSRDGAAELLGRDFRLDRDGGRYALAKLLAEFQASSSAGSRLVMLDAGSIVQDPRLGMLVNEFPQLAIDAVHAAKDPQLWVLVSHGPLEYSHVSPAWRETLFAHFTQAGLAGAADLNTDGNVDLAELARYLTANVSAYVKAATGGRESQTPMLLWGGGAQLPAGKTLTDLASQTVVAPIHKQSNPKAAPAIARSAARTRLQAAVEAGWKLRDDLDDSRIYQPSFLDFAPLLWRKYEATLLAAERLTWPDAELADARAVALAADLERTNARLADILADRRHSATLTPEELGAQLTEAQPEVISGLNDVRSFALLDRLAWAPGTAVIREIKSLEREFDERLLGPERDLFVWATGPASKYSPLVELRLTTRVALRTQRLPFELAKAALLARRSAEQAAARATHYGVPSVGEGWAPFWLRDRMQQADQLLVTAERALIDDSVELAEMQAEPLREAQRLYTSAMADANRVQESLRVRNTLLFRAPYYLDWQRHAGAKATAELRAAMDAPSAAEMRELLGHLKAMAQLQLAPPGDLPAQLESQAHAAATLLKKLDQAFGEGRLQSLEEARDASVVFQVQTLLSTPLPSAPARKRLLAVLAKASEKDAFASPQPAATVSAPASVSAADWQTWFSNLELQRQWIQLSASLTGKPQPLDQEWGAVNAAFQQFSQSATPELEAALWQACRAYGAAQAAWQAGLPGQLLAQQKLALETEDPNGPGPRFAALQSIHFQTAWIDPRDAQAAEGLQAAELMRRTQLQCLFYWHEQRFLAAAEGARQADQTFFREAARVYHRQGDLLKAGK